MVIQNCIDKIQKSGIDTSTEQDLNGFINYFEQHLINLHFTSEEMVFERVFAEYAVIQNHHGIYLKNEHEILGEQVSFMKNNMNDVNVLTEKANEFVSTLELHSHKEDTFLFPDIAEKVANDTLDAVSKDCQKYMDENKQSNQEMMDLANNLQTKYGTEHKKEKL